MRSGESLQPGKAKRETGIIPSPSGVEADKAKHRFARRNAYRRKAGGRDGVIPLSLRERGKGEGTAALPSLSLLQRQ